MSLGVDEFQPWAGTVTTLGRCIIPCHCIKVANGGVICRIQAALDGMTWEALLIDWEDACKQVYVFTFAHRAALPKDPRLLEELLSKCTSLSIQSTRRSIAQK